MADSVSVFRYELELLINKHSIENGSNTPDFLLAEFLTDCLAAFDKTTNLREKWYGRPTDGNPFISAEPDGESIDGR